ncbi:MAG: sensor histidine kinase [Oscillospiraceae bacterium]
MKIFVNYLKYHIKNIVIYILVVGIFLAVFSLYNLPLEAVIYAFTLSFFVIFVFGIVDFLGFYNRHKILQNLQNHITISLDELPEENNLLQSDYNFLLKILFESRNKIESNNALKLSEMTDYYTMWAHQIKTPIAAMRLLLQTDETLENAELSEQLFKIEQYVEMVLQYLRMDSLSADLVVKKYSLEKIVKQAVRKYAKSFIRKKISLDLDELLCEVLTDEKWLELVIEQVISNALKYTNEGKISIFLDKVSPKTLVISDTGIGVAPEDLPRVFEKGFTGFNGHIDKKSTGIGLYLCQKIMKKLSHKIEITSEKGKGTTVRLFLDSADTFIE